MKKFLGTITVVVLILLFAFGTISSFAAPKTPAYQISDINVEKGESFSLTVSLKDNPGIISLKFKVEYDSSLLRLDRVEDLGLLEGFTKPSPQISSPYTLRWSNSLWSDPNTPGSTAEGDLIRLDFTVIAKSKADTTISILHEESYDNNSQGEEIIEFANAESKVSIKNKYTVTFYNDDGTTVVSSSKYFEGEKITLPETPTKAPDGENKFIFTSWTPELPETVTSNLSFTAQYVSAPMSTDCGLLSLSAEGVELSPSFSPDVTSYTATVDFTVSVLNILCETSNEFATYEINTNELKVGVNNITVTVTAENGDTQIFELTVTRKQDPNYVEDTDSLLSSLTASSGILSPIFKPTQKNYILYVENSTKSVSFECTPRSDRASEVSSNEAHELNASTTSIELICVAENGDSSTYKVIVVKLPIYTGEVPDFVFDGKNDTDTDLDTDTDTDTDKDNDNDKKDPDGNSGSSSNGGTDDDSGNEKKNSSLGSTAIIIIVAASLCAILSIVGIVFLIVANKKNKTK